MGFLDFLHKKVGPKKDSLAMPLPPPKMGGEEEPPAMPPANPNQVGLPDFTERTEDEELKLPDIAELDNPDVMQAPKVPEINEHQEFPEIKTEVVKPLEMPELQLPVREEPEQVEQDASEIYKNTPAKPAGSLFHREEPEYHAEQPQHLPPTGDVFMRAEDYRDLIEDLNRIIAAQKEEFSKEEKDNFRLEEREHEKFVVEIEELQRSIIVTENTLFE